MALFSLKRIAGEAENRQTYLRGVACYNAGKVGRVVRDRDDFYEEYLSADVENNTRDGVFRGRLWPSGGRRFLRLRLRGLPPGNRRLPAYRGCYGP